MRKTIHPLRIGLIGNDLSSSLSPVIHTAEAEILGLRGYRYETIDLAGLSDPDLGKVLVQALGDGFTGFNVTHPHKQKIIPFLDSIAPSAAVLGSVNAVVVGGDGLVGHNTDRSGFLAALHGNLPGSTARNSAVLFGAGGAGAAIAAALLDFGVEDLKIVDVVPAHANQLRELLKQARPAGSITIEAGGQEDAEEWVRAADGVVNATPIGMEHISGTPFSTAWLHSGQWVADIVYRPVTTKLLADAAALGCKVMDGTAMLVEQAADTFVLVTGTQPQRKRMRAHLTEILAPLPQR